MLLDHLLLFFKAVVTIGFVEEPPFGILPSVFELVPGQAVFMEVGDETVAGTSTSLGSVAASSFACLISFASVGCVVLFCFVGLCCMAYEILVPRPGIEPRLLAVRVLSPNHWTTREFPPLCFHDPDVHSQVQALVVSINFVY